MVVPQWPGTGRPCRRVWGVPWRSQIRSIWRVRAAVRSWVRPGSAGDSQRIFPLGSVATCAFTPCSVCFEERSALPSPKRSHSATVELRRRTPLSAARELFPSRTPNPHRPVTRSVTTLKTLSARRLPGTERVACRELSPRWLYERMVSGARRACLYEIREGAESSRFPVRVGGSGAERRR